MTEATTPLSPTARPGQEPFAEFLARGGSALFDGAMGTMLYARGVFINRAFEELNLTRPGLVRELHAAYVAAGAQILETNTFAANRFRLSPHGLAAQVDEINGRGAEVAREAADGQAWVAGAIGPLGVRIEPFGPIAREEARAVFTEQVRALVAGGVDLLILETFSHLPEIEEAIRGVRAVTDLPIVAQVAVAKRGVTREGVDPGDAAARLEAAGASVVGVNCSEALAVLDALEGMRQAVSLPLSAQPNAGQPHTVDGRNLYLASPDYLVAWGRQALRSGARFLGGCCGTSPDHIRALRQAVGAAPPIAAPVKATRPVRPSGEIQPIATAKKSRLAERLASSSFVRGIELPLPIGWEVDTLATSLDGLVEDGVEFVTLLDGPRTEARMSPVALAQVCLRRGGVEPIVQFSCRERRLSRIQSDLLGAYATGVANLLIVTGPPSSPAVDAPPDLEVDSIGAVNLVHHLNHGQDIGGNLIGKPTGFFTGVRLDPSHYDRAREISRYQWKVAAGAEFAVTAPIFDVAALEGLLMELPQRVPVLATVWPLRGAREAQFFEVELSEVPVPAPLIQRMQAAEAAGRQEEEGIAIAREIVAALQPLVDGVQVVAPDGRLDLAVAVLSAGPQGSGAAGQS